MTVTIYHNPRCSKSRNTLALLREHGTEPEIVEYLKDSLTRDRLLALVGKSGVPFLDLLRSNETIYKELGLADAERSDAELADIVLEHPILLNRPIVETPTAAKLCRPEKLALDLLDAPQTSNPLSSS